MNPSGAVAVVTGANRGLCRELVTAVARADAIRIYAAARDPVALPDFEAYRAEIVPLRLDITGPQQVAAAATMARDATLLVNNAGVLPYGRALAIGEEYLRLSLEVNVLGTWRVARAFAPTIRANGGGAIVNDLTLLSLHNEQSFAAYVAAKTASWSMTQSMRSDLASTGVRGAAAFPGGIDTEMLAGVPALKARPDDVACAIVAGLSEGALDIFPDRISAKYGPGMLSAVRRRA